MLHVKCACRFADFREKKQKSKTDCISLVRVVSSETKKSKNASAESLHQFTVFRKIIEKFEEKKHQISQEVSELRRNPQISTKISDFHRYRQISAKIVRLHQKQSDFRKNIARIREHGSIEKTADFHKFANLNSCLQKSL